MLTPCFNLCYGQHADSVVSNHDNIPQQEDIIDYARRLAKINVTRKPDSEAVKPGKVLLAVFPAVGYTVINGGIGVISANISFYTSDKRTTNLSTITANPQYSTRQQTLIPIISNIWLKKNEINLLGDYRFYKYPSFTYGLGGSSSISNEDRIDYYYIKVYQEVLKHITGDWYVGLGYNFDYHYNILDYDASTDFELYANDATVSKSSGLVAHIKYDSRTNINNPKNAAFASVVYRNNFSWLGSDQNWQSLQFEFRKYIQFSSYPDKVLAFWSWNEITFGGVAPYLDLPSTGWDTYANTGRGYIQGRYRGTSLFYGETEFRFGLTKNGLLGAVVFVNAQVVPEWPSGQYTTINPGEGIGLRIKLNRFSDANLCIDYAFGTEGSQGIFFNLGEVF